MWVGRGERREASGKEWGVEVEVEASQSRGRGAPGGLFKWRNKSRGLKNT
jgi:hypothetical protein